MKRKIALLTTGWSYEYVFSVMNGIQKAIVDDDIDLYLFVCYGYYDEKPAFNQGEYNIFNLIHYEDFDGVILFANIFNSLEVLEREKCRILESKTPVLCLEYLVDGLDYIGTDNYSGMHEITEHLIKVHGLHDIAYLGGPATNYESSERMRAFLDAMKENGLQPDPKRVIEPGDWSYDFAYRHTTSMVENHDLPEAIVCVNDEGAIAVLTCLYKHGIKVPEEVKVVGFDDTSSAASFTPSLSTVNRNWDQLGERAIQHLKKQMNGEEVERKELLSSSAVLRGSCGCVTELSEEQRNNCMDAFYRQKMTLDFGSHLRHLEEFFIEIDDPGLLSEEMQKFFQEDHFFEGDTFCFMAEPNTLPLAINIEDLDQGKTHYSDELLKVVHMEDGELRPKELFETRKLIPESMVQDQNSVFLFVSLHFQDKILGYFVCRDQLRLLENRYCYDWSKGISNGFEKYCQRHIYMLMNQELTDMYIRDAMTGLLNRMGYKRLAYQYYNHNRQQKKDTIIIFADIDSMKSINDNYGHLHGDLAIKTVAEILQKVFPKEWLGIRYGGDEYLVIGTVYNSDQVKRYCEEAATQLKKRVKRMALPYELSISMGQQIITPDQNITLDDAVKMADETMYRNKTQFHDKERENHNAN